MFLSAVSAGLVIGGLADDQIGRLSDREQRIWKRMEPSIVTVIQGGRPTGPAALVASSGWFVAHRNAVLADEIDAKTFDGRTVHLRVKGQDDITQLLLLKADDWPEGLGRPFTAPDGSEQPGGTILAVLANGPIRAEFVSGSRVGVMKPSRRLVPLNEFRFEAPAQEVGTALVLSENGELLGALHATLTPVEESNPSLGNTLRDPGRGLGNLIPDILKPKIGPADMTVAYTAGAQLVRRVLNGFLSTEHKVEYPSLGVLCSDAVGGGALVQQVTSGSPAQKAGIRVGDVIQDIGGRLVRNQVDFARVMLDQEVGRRISIRIKRGAAVVILDAVIARAESL